MIKEQISILMVVMSGLCQPLSAQSLFHRIDSTVASRYYHMRGIDTTYISRPTTKWTISARMNVSGTKIKTEGMDNGRHFLSEMKADRKATLSLGVSYLGVSLSASLNPAKFSASISSIKTPKTSQAGTTTKGWNVSNCLTVYYQ